jgi:hypothetical protein
LTAVEYLTCLVRTQSETQNPSRYFEAGRLGLIKSVKTEVCGYIRYSSSVIRVCDSGWKIITQTVSLFIGYLLAIYTRLDFEVVACTFPAIKASILRLRTGAVRHCFRPSNLMYTGRAVLIHAEQHGLEPKAKQLDHLFNHMLSLRGIKNSS